MKQPKPRKVAVTVTLKIRKPLWKVFTATLDEKSRQDFLNYAANGMMSHLMSPSENPDLLAEYIYRQNKRLARKPNA